MATVVGVAFKPVGKIHYFDINDIELNINDSVIVESPPGTVLGTVMHPPHNINEDNIAPPLLKVIRHATKDDIAKNQSLEEKQNYSLQVCKEKVTKLKLNMKLLEAEWTLDETQVTFHFVAEGRIDFRELVREVASVLHTRVIMHQVGPREHAKVITGMGPCGRPTCCAAFLREFEPVSMKMAKGQNLTLNPTKFSGICGKLMCCLRYEYNGKDNGKSNIPEIGSVVTTPLGRAKLEEINGFQETATVQLESGQFVEVKLQDIIYGKSKPFLKSPDDSDE